MEQIDVNQIRATGTPSASTVLSGSATAGTGIWTSSPTFTAPVLGTPVSGTLTSCTGLPLTGLLAAAYSTTPTASTLAEWDANVNLSANAFIEQVTSTTTSAATLTLTIASDAIQLFTGSTTGQIVALPTTSVVAGVKYRIINNSSTAVTVNASAGATVVVMSANTDCAFTALAATPTTPAGWEAQYGGTTVTVTAAGTLTLNGGNQCYVFSGTTATWTLPALAGNTGSNLILENRGSGAVTVNAAGSDHIWFQSSVTTMTIAAGGSLPLINDGSFWNSIATDLVHNAVGTLAVANGGTGVQTLTGIPKASGTSAFVAATAGTDYLTPGATQTVTATRITKRTSTTNAPGATPSMNTDNFDLFIFTGLAVAITSMTTNLTGTPVNGDQLLIRFTDNATARAITWGAKFGSSGVATLLATTVISKIHTVGLIWDATKALWICLAVDATGY